MQRCPVESTPEQSMTGTSTPEQGVPEGVNPEQFWTMTTTPEHGEPVMVTPEQRGMGVEAAADIIPRV